jgi:2-hydroxy-4-carboxymuconate semialdehyde hemiacetal dehydrogenase
MTIKVALAGAGAFGIKHLDGIKNIADVEVVSLIGRDLAKTREVADKYGVAHVTDDLNQTLAIKEVDAVILCTPTQMHAGQTAACLRLASTFRWKFRWPTPWLVPKPPPCKSKPAGGHVRPYPPLQPQPPVGTQQDYCWRVQHPANGCANLLLPPQQYERAGPAAQLDRPPAVAPCRPHVDLFAYQAGSPIVKANAIQGRFTRNWASPWTCPSS